LPFNRVMSGTTQCTFLSSWTPGGFGWAAALFGKRRAEKGESEVGETVETGERM